MPQPPRITHAYRMPDGWEHQRSVRLTPEVADDLRSQGFTMVRVRSGLFASRELSLSRFVRH